MPCDGAILRDLAHADLLARLRQAGRERACAPLTATLDWTECCNLRCGHCYIRALRPACDALSTAQWKAILDELAARGVLALVVTGGEPLVRPDFRALYAHAHARGFLLTLFSNGTLLDRPLLDFLAARPPRAVELTVYGHTAPVYETVTGVPGSFRRFRRAVAGLLARGMRLKLKAVILRANRAEFEPMREWAAGLGCDFRYDPLLHPRLDGSATPLAGRLAPEEIAALQFADPGEKASYGARRDRLLRLPPQSALFECGAGQETMHVDSRGRTHPCMIWRADPYDLTRRRLDGHWHRHIRRLRARPAPPGPCAACRLRGLCGSCPALARLETGDPGRAVSFYCRLAEARELRA